MSEKREINHALHAQNVLRWQQMKGGTPAPDKESRRLTRARTLALLPVAHALSLGWRQAFDGRAWSRFQFEKGGSILMVEWATGDPDPSYMLSDSLQDRVTGDTGELIMWLNVEAMKDEGKASRLVMVAPHLFQAAKDALPYLKRALEEHDQRRSLRCKWWCACGLGDATAAIESAVHVVEGKND